MTFAWKKSKSHDETAEHWQGQIFYIPLLALAMAIIMFRPLLVAKFLDVNGFAIYSKGLLISATFCVLGCLGLYGLLQREMPAQLLKGRVREGAILLMQCVLAAVFCALFFLVFIGVGSSVLDADNKILFVSVIHGFSQQIFLLATIESRSRGQPMRFAKQNMARAVLLIASASASCLVFDSASSILLAESIVSILIAARILTGFWKSCPTSLSCLIKIAILEVRSIPWRSAMALLAVVVISSLIFNLDRWLAATFLPEYFFAQYAFAWIILLAAQSVQSIINASVFPYLARCFAIEGFAHCFKITARVSVCLFICGWLISWLAYWVGSTVIYQWFPEYVESINLLYIFIVAAIFHLSNFWSSFLIIVGEEKFLLLINLFMLAFVLVLWVIFVYIFGSGSVNFQNLPVLALSFAVANHISIFFVACKVRDSSVATFD